MTVLSRAISVLAIVITTLTIGLRLGAHEPLTFMSGVAATMAIICALLLVLAPREP